MSTDLATREVVVPHTGEVLDLPSASAETLAELLAEVRDVETRLRELKGEVSLEVHTRMDRARSWTLDAGDYKLGGRSDEPEVTYDPDALAFVLTGLVEAGTIDPAAMDAAIVAVTTWKVKRAGVKALCKSPALAEAIDACATVAPPENRRLSVSRKAAA